MPTNIDMRRIRRVFGREEFEAPQPFGEDGFTLLSRDHKASIIVTCADHDGDDWIHASIAHTDRLPTYDELKLLHYAAFGDGWSYQVFPPKEEHVNIHAYALHLWGRLDGKPALPNFAEYGSI